MDYLVTMKLVAASRALTPPEGLDFIENYVLPTLQACAKFRDEGRILAGGPVAGSIELALIVRAESIQQLDEILASLPLWPRMETAVTPVTTFTDREQTVRQRLAGIKARLHASATA
jgi:muconolactone delta-isomerase